jgi:hypothetical protein
MGTKLRYLKSLLISLGEIVGAPQIPANFVEYLTGSECPSVAGHDAKELGIV